MTKAKGGKQKRADGTAASQDMTDIEAILDDLRLSLNRYVASNDGTIPTAQSTPAPAVNRSPGRFKGKIVVGPEFFDPLTRDDIKELAGE